MHTCCSRPDVSPGQDARPRRRRPGRLREALGWAAPIATLALVPKCPLCMAGYILLLTGAGVSLSTAAAIRWTLIVGSLAVISALALRLAVQAFWKGPRRRQAGLAFTAAPPKHKPATNEQAPGGGNR